MRLPDSSIQRPVFAVMLVGSLVMLGLISIPRLGIDLFPHVRYWNTPVDDELPWRVTDGRRVERKIWDTLWLRPIDIGRALEGRSYRSAGRLVLGVSDPAIPDNDGCYELDASPEGARCRRTSADPDVEEVLAQARTLRADPASGPGEEVTT